MAVGAVGAVGAAGTEAAELSVTLSMKQSDRAEGGEKRGFKEKQPWVGATNTKGQGAAAMPWGAPFSTFCEQRRYQRGGVS